MTRGNDVDTLIRHALRAEDVAEFDALGEPGLPEMVTEVFRGRLWWAGVMFMFMVLVFFVGAVFCAIRFFAADGVPQMLHWGLGFLFCVITVIGGKIWYWMQLDRVATMREIKRVELLVAQLALELRAGAAD